MKKRWIAFILCLTLLCSLIPTLGIGALAIDLGGPTYSPETVFKLSVDGDPFVLVLVTLVDSDGTVYTAEKSGEDSDYCFYQVDEALADGKYSVYENGYLIKEIEIVSGGQLSEMVVPCYSVYFKVHESGAAVGTKLTAKYVPYEGAEAQTVVNFSALPVGGTLNFTAVPAGADNYTLKWAFAAPYAEPNDDGSYSYSTALTGELDLICWVQGSYNTQSLEDAITITYPESGTTATKITNPTHGSGEADGLNTNDPIYPANRINSYAWAMGSNTYTGPTTEKLTNGKEYLYVGTNRNVYGGSFIALETDLLAGLAQVNEIPISVLRTSITKSELMNIFNIALDLYFNGDIPQVRSLFGNEFYMALSNCAENWIGQIIRIDPDTGENEVVYTNGINGSNYRSANKMNNNLYFGSAFGSMNSIVKIDGNGNAAPIFANGVTAGSDDYDLSLRAGTVYNESKSTLICGGVVGVKKNAATNLWDISGTTDAETALPVVFLLKDNGDGTSSTKVICDASGEEFNIITKADSEFLSGVYSGGIWDICMYHDEPYMTVVEKNTFSLWHGREAQIGEQDNGYGWIWEKVWSRDSGTISDSISFVAGDVKFESNAEDCTATMCVYNDKLYLACFDNFGTIVFKTLISSFIDAATSSSSTYFTDTYTDLFNYMQHPCSVFTYDGTTVKMDTDFEKEVANYNIDYLWRTIVYDGDLYVTTGDLETMHNYTLPMQTNRTQYILDTLGITVDYSFADIAEMLSVLREQSNFLDSFSFDGMPFEIRPDSAASLFANLLSHIAKDSSGKSLNVSAIDVMHNLKLLTWLNRLSIIAERFENGSIDYAKMLDLLDALAKQYSNVEIVSGFTVGNLAEAIDFPGILMLDKIINFFNNNEDGLDIYVLDHETGHWETILTDGFNDPYNYGGRTLAICNNKLYVGTANPFYGAQIWRVDYQGKKVTPSVSNYDPTYVETLSHSTAGRSVADFTDISGEAYYYEGLSWAVKNNIADGTSATTFSPDASVTRGQLMTFLWRAAGCPEPTITSCAFTDVSADSYYYKAILWAVEKGITTGMTATTFAPNTPVTRAQALTFLWRYSGAPKFANMTASGPAPSPFSDVSNTAYYYNAILWAVAEKVTQGQSATTFAPNNTCSRGQAVTMLFRVFA